MQAKKQTINAGKGTKKSASWLSVSINPDVVKQYIQEYNGKKFIKLNININETPDQYGKDVSVSVDTWTPNGELKPNVPQEVKTESIQSAEPTPIVNDDVLVNMNLNGQPFGEILQHHGNTFKQLNDVVHLNRNEEPGEFELGDIAAKLIINRVVNRIKENLIVKNPTLDDIIFPIV